MAVGVAIDSLEDMEIVLRESSPLDKVSTSMTINVPQQLLAMYQLGRVRSRGVDALA